MLRPLRDPPVGSPGGDVSASTTGNLADLVRAAAAESPDKPALLFHGSTTTWAELDAQVSAAARGLLSLGAVTGDRVAVHLGNTPEFVVVYFGALRAGLVALPVNTGYTAEELRHVLGDSGARIVVTSAAGADTVRSVDAGLTVVVTGSTSYDELLAAKGDLAAVGGGEDLAVVLYTSGTSGRPRGAMLTHRALLANLEQTARIDPPVVAADDVVLLVLPLFHVFGLNAALGSVAWHGATGVLVERFDPVETLALLRRHGVTNVVGAPPMYVAWSMLPDVGDAFSTVRLALSGAAPLPPSVLRRVLDVTGHHVFEGYGLTETAPVLTTTLMSEVAKAGSIGQPVPGVELRLLDTAGRPVEEGDPGEIVVRGPNLFSGYWPDGAESPDADGWLATGDVAVVDADGDLFLVDRRRELVLVSGFNVYPREVEDVLGDLEGVEEAAVLGIPHPYTGESVKALVVLGPGARLTTEDVVAHCARRLARFKCPTAVEFVPSLPHSANGKVAKGRLRELWG
jgi:long-chain acyl-CoA synthetase